jgi:2-oxoglutarate/2-oxoacid ferredoxin oxidoreductase subunit beta
MADDLTTYHENTWCPGCGNFGLFNALKKAVLTLEKKGVPREKLIQTTGIGCHGKMSDYLAVSGFATLHGRALAVAQGIKLANPELRVFSSVGDGDTIGEGLEHLIFAAKRNADITALIHNNGVYALTTGQVTPLSERGFRGPSTPLGNPEDPLNPLALMLESGATFVARGYAGKVDHLADLIVRAIEHEGFSYIDILQPCVSFNNTYERYNRTTEVMQEPPASYDDAMRAVKRRDRLLLGVFYEAKKKPYHLEILGDRNPAAQRLSREERIERVRKLIEV